MHKYIITRKPSRRKMPQERDMMTTTGVMPPITRRPLYGSKVYVDADDIEGDERFSVVQFKFREIIFSELGEIGNIGFHRVFLRIIFCLFGSGEVSIGRDRGRGY